MKKRVFKSILHPSLKFVISFLVDYLGRYTHRIAIGNHPILKMEDGQVFFLWHDYADGSKKKIMKLGASEFIRTFLLHV